MSASFVVSGRKRRPLREACGWDNDVCAHEGFFRMLGSHLFDLCRGRGAVIARTSAAAGLTLTRAGALSPAATATAPAAGGQGGQGGHSLRSLLNPSGAESHADPVEEMAAQQSFAARHFGAAGLSAP